MNRTNWRMRLRFPHRNLVKIPEFVPGKGLREKVKQTTMEENIPKYFCKSCGKKITKEDTICPHCGSDLKKVGRHIELTLTEKIKLSDGLRAKQKRKGISGYLTDLKYRRKISGKTKRPTREQLIIDRTDSTKTMKKHYVEEWDGKQWVVVHDEQEEFKAKRR